MSNKTKYLVTDDENSQHFVEAFQFNVHGKAVIFSNPAPAGSDIAEPRLVAYFFMPLSVVEVK